MNITAKTKVCMSIGDPIEHSLSPQMHNAGYNALGIDFVYLASRVKIGDVQNFIKGMRAMHLRGVSVTLPHKLEVMKYLDNINPTAKKIGAVNTIVNNDGFLEGNNTDWLGVISPLEKITTLKNKNVAVLGAGGAARSAVYGLTQKGAKITIFNRTFDKAKTLAEEFGTEVKSMDEISDIKEMDIVINATSLGLTDNSLSPIEAKNIKDKQIIFDFVYSSIGLTKLITDAKQKGAKTITGIDMLLAQGIVQFKLFTGHEAPEEAMRRALP